jgi:hypothetical protein
VGRTSEPSVIYFLIILRESGEAMAEQ